MTDPATIARQRNAEALMEDIRHNNVVIEVEGPRGIAQWRLSMAEKDTLLAALREYADAR